MFFQHLKSNKSTSVPTYKVVDQVLTTPAATSLWENIIADLDSQISSECNKLAPENFVKLYV